MKVQTSANIQKDIPSSQISLAQVWLERAHTTGGSMKWCDGIRIAHLMVLGLI